MSLAVFVHINYAYASMHIHMHNTYTDICALHIYIYATANMLKLNDSKTELMLVSSKRSEHLHDLPTSITIGNAQIPFKSL